MEVYEPIDLPRLSPALTPEERLHLDLYGYVIIENTLSADEVGTLRDTVYGLEERVRAGDTLPPPAYVHSAKRWFFRVDNLPHLAPCFLDYLTHPRLWGMAEEAVGGDARLEQSDVTIRRATEDHEQAMGLHWGAYNAMAWTAGGLFHYPFVKTLTNLTDLGPDDGGTVVVPGSHRLSDEARSEAVRIASSDPTFVHQVVAPAGSTAFFFEATIHGSGIIRSRQDRMFIIGGYTPTMYQPWHEYDPDPEWLATLPRGLQLFLNGGNRWLWQPRVRKLADPVQSLEDAERAMKERCEKANEIGNRARAYQRDAAIPDD